MEVGGGRPVPGIRSPSSNAASNSMLSLQWAPMLPKLGWHPADLVSGSALLAARNRNILQLRQCSQGRLDVADGPGEPPDHRWSSSRFPVRPAIRPVLRRRQT